MEFDALTAGVNPGGLISTLQIKVLICYMLYSIKKPIDKQIIAELLQNEGIANYFEVVQAISEMTDGGFIKQGEKEHIEVTEKGRNISSELEYSLPPLIKKRALKAALAVLSKIEIQQSNSAEIQQTESGYNVVLTVKDFDKPLMSLNIAVPDKMQAEEAKELFMADPINFYAGVIALLTGDADSYLKRFAK